MKIKHDQGGGCAGLKSQPSQLRVRAFPGDRSQAWPDIKKVATLCHVFPSPEYYGETKAFTCESLSYAVCCWGQRRASEVNWSRT